MLIQHIGILDLKPVINTVICMGKLTSGSVP
jgi:hypothetical protein